MFFSMTILKDKDAGTSYSIFTSKVLQALSKASSWSHALRLVAANAKMLDVNALQRGWRALEVQHQAAGALEIEFLCFSFL